MITIDVQGEPCPKPLIIAKKAINEMAPGDQFEIITNSETSLHNLTTFLTALHTEPRSEKHGGAWHVFATKPMAMELSDLPAEDFCQTTPPGNKNHFVVVIKSNQMGQGDEALGKILIRGFINSLKEQNRLPTHVILYNSGVQLAVNGTDTSQSLIELEAKGVSVVVCGTCVDFYELKDKMAVGMISNMLHITKLMQETDKVITP